MPPTKIKFLGFCAVFGVEFPTIVIEFAANPLL